MAPVEAIVARMALPGLSSTAATTIGTKVYVADLERWLARLGPVRGGAPARAGPRAPPLAARVEPWIERYLRDGAFMWAEEQRGWYVQWSSCAAGA